MTYETKFALLDTVIAFEDECDPIVVVGIHINLNDIGTRYTCLDEHGDVNTYSEQQLEKYATSAEQGEQTHETKKI